MSPAAGGRRITISSISCRGVRAFVPFQKPPLYAAVSLGGRREKTPADPDGGENPDWDGVVVAFDIDGDDGEQQPEEQLVLFQVKAQVPLLGNKLVGTAGVPVADLAAGGGGGGAALRHVSYQVSAPDGRPNGTLSFAYAVSGGAGGVGPQLKPELCPVPDGARPEQGPSFSCAPPPPPTSAPYPAPATANIAPYGGGYPPPASASLYPPLQDLLAPSSYPPPPPHPVTANPPFPAPNSCSYPAPAPAPVTAYPPPPASSTAYPAPPAQYITSYPPPTTNYPPPPLGYPPPASNLDPPTSTYRPPPPNNYPPPPPSGYPPPASNLDPPTGTYPPPAPDSGSAYPVLPRSTPSPAPSTVDRALPYYPAPPSQDAASTYPAPPGGSHYPPPGSRYPELDGAGRTPYYYPPPGTRYP
ncbi:hypothetical protein ACP70R_008218 [Stipagrostis hirtigluma subsp. patula]